MPLFCPGQETYLSHMSWRIRILRPENGTNTVNPLFTLRNLKLLVELWRLCQICFLLEIRQFEHIRTTLRSSTNQARRMELLEVLFLQVLAKQFFDGISNIGDSLADRRAPVHGGVVEMRSQTGNRCSFCNSKSCIQLALFPSIHFKNIPSTPSVTSSSSNLPTARLATAKVIPNISGAGAIR
jgi:hypothetical protein